MDGNQQPQQPESWQFTPEQAPQSVAVPPTGAAGSITWTASEFINHHKTAGWYATLTLVAVIGAALAWLITKDVITAISIVGAAGLLAAYASRQPRELTYRVDQSGLHIGPRFYHFHDFRSFGVMAEGAFSSITFIPLKRFAPMLTVYYDPKDEAKIVDVLSAYIPFEARNPDPIERLMWRIRF